MQEQQEPSGTGKPMTLSCLSEQGMKYKPHFFMKAALYQLNSSLLLGIMLDTSTTTLTGYVQDVLIVNLRIERSGMVVVKSYFHRRYFCVCQLATYCFLYKAAFC